MNKFEQAFENNFYLTKEFGDFCSDVTRITLGKKSLSDQTFFILKNKNISISNYDEGLRAAFQKEHISYFSVLPEENKKPNPSFVEYSIFHKTSYDFASKNYKTSFFHGLREGKKFPHQTKTIKNPNPDLLKEIYRIYREQIKRKNSTFMPFYFFERYIQCPSSLLFILEYEKAIIAYAFCFQYKDNLYFSFGGGNPEFFYLKSSNKLYDELISYACNNNLNLHMGTGIHNSGYQIFKQNAGAFNHKTQRFPDNTRKLKISFRLLNFKLTGKILFAISKLFSKKIVFGQMPIT